MFYQDLHFCEDIVEDVVSTANAEKPIQKWHSKDKHQLCHEPLQWLGFQGDGIDILFFMTTQFSVQSSVKNW